MDEFARFLATIADLKAAGRWEEIINLIGKRLRHLMGVNLKEFRDLTESGLFSQLIINGPMATVWVPYKQIMLIALLKETGDYAAMREPPEGGNGWYLRALDLLLDALSNDELRHYSHLAPTVEVLLTSLGNSPLPVRTLTSLIREYKRRGLSIETIEESMAKIIENPRT